jgi:hypothetical protein
MNVFEHRFHPFFEVFCISGVTFLLPAILALKSAVLRFIDCHIPERLEPKLKIG